MLTAQRHEEIMQILQEKGAVSVNELTESLNTSESTIRRDLAALAKMGKLNKVHGGATLTAQDLILREDTIDDKLQKQIREKRAIASYAASQIQPGDFVYLDAGTTTLLMVEFMKPGNVTFVTNGIVHAKELVKKGFRTYILGGELKSTTEAVIGAAAVQNLRNYNFSKSFLGVNGLSVRQGYTTPDMDEACVKDAAIHQSFVSYVLADSSKLGKVSTVSFAPLEAAVLITDRLTDPSYAEKTIVKEVG